MDFLTFIASLVGAIAWPIAIVVIMLVYRKELKALVPLIRKLKAGPLEAEFEREVKAIEAESAGSVVLEPTEELKRHQQMLWGLADINPRSAILEAWLGVESAVRKAALQKIETSPPPDVSSPLRTFRDLLHYGIVTNEDAALFHDLRGLRNQAAHLQDFNPSKESVRNYINLASQLEIRLSKIEKPNR